MENKLQVVTIEGRGGGKGLTPNGGKLWLKIHDEKAPDLCTALGISEARRLEISTFLDNQIKNAAGSVVKTCNLYQEIVAFCNNLEEVAYSITIHCMYMERTGNGY